MLYYDSMKVKKYKMFYILSNLNSDVLLFIIMIILLFKTKWETYNMISKYVKN